MFCEPHRVTFSIGEDFFAYQIDGIGKETNEQTLAKKQMNRQNMLPIVCLQRELELWNFSRYMLLVKLVILYVDLERIQEEKK